MIRRPPHSDDDGPTDSPIDDHELEPISSPPRTPDVIEVALFMIPGPRKPGATVVDLRNANKLSWPPDPASSLPLDQDAVWPALNELPLQEVADRAPDAPSPAEAQLFEFLSESLPDAEAIAFPSEDAIATPPVRWAAAAAIARRATGVLVSSASAASHLRVKAGRTSRQMADAVRAATPTTSQIRRKATDASKRIADTLALAGPAVTRVRTAAGHLSREVAKTAALVPPAAARASRETGHALRATQAQLGVWHRAHVLPVVSRIPSDRRVPIAAAAAASVLLAIAVANVDLAPSTDTARNQGAMSASQQALDGRPLAPVARLARRVAATRPTIVPAPAPEENEAPVERRAAAEPVRRSVTPQESKAAAVAAVNAATSLPAVVEEKPLAPPVPDATPAAGTSAAEAAAASAPPPAARTTAPVERAAAVARPGDADGIVEALRHLERAYEQRDAELAKAVWPTVNERALARAFDGLRSQTVAFDRCQVNVVGSAGEVECRGTTTYVPRVGSRYARTESRQWQFRLQKGMDSWLITSAAAR